MVLGISRMNRRCECDVGGYYDNKDSGLGGGALTVSPKTKDMEEISV